MDQKLGFVVVIEQGDLEAMALLLVESIRRQPSLQGCPIFVIQPRRGNTLSPNTLRQLTNNHAWYLNADLNQVWRQHNLMNKVYAAAFIESMVENSLDTLIYLDSDIFVAASPDGIRLKHDQMVGAAPIAEWRLGKVGQLVDEPLNDYWKMIYTACLVKNPPDWHITTTIDRRKILPYFNTGVIAVRPSQAIFRQWRENVERLATDDRSSRQARNSGEFYFLEQASFAGTLLARFSQEQIRILEHRYNYPLHAHHLLPDHVRAAAMNEICFLHYHGHFTNLYWMDDINITEPLRGWLVSRLPLRPRLRFTSGSAALYLSHLLSTFPLRPYHHRIVNRIPGLCRTVPYPAGR